MINYILDGKNVVECNDVLEWKKWFQDADKHVAKTEKDGIRVSTIFIGINQSFDKSEPLLFETMIFGGEHDKEQWQYSTWEEAEKGHIEAVSIAGL